MDLAHEREHWMGYTLKEYREKYEELVFYASDLEFKLKILEEENGVQTLPTEGTRQEAR